MVIVCELNEFILFNCQCPNFENVIQSPLEL